MPKNSSKSDKDWVSGTDILNARKSRWVWGAVIAAVLLAVGVFFFWKPKPLAVEDVVPSDAIFFARIRHLDEHLKSFRSSMFWQGVSKLDVPKLLEHSEADAQTIENYNAWRSGMTGVIDSPLFKQFLGREAAVAFYPIADHADLGDWKNYLSGTLVVVRVDAKVQIAESLANFWPHSGKDWTTEASHYKNTTITALHFKKSAPVVYYTRLRNLLVVSANQKLVESAIDAAKHETASLNRNENFAGVRNHFYNSPDGVFYVNVLKAKDFAAKFLDQLSKIEDEETEEDEDGEEEDGPSAGKFKEALEREELRFSLPGG